MNKLRTLILKLISFAILLFRFSWVKFFQSLDNKSDIIVWLQQDTTIRGWYRNIRYEGIIIDMALLQSMLDEGKKFRLVIGAKIGPMTNKHIFYNISEQFNRFGFSDHSKPVWQTILSLEEEGNYLYPPSRDALFWENKAHMHREFERLNIPSPKTLILESNLDGDTNLNFPGLLKETHSNGSAGVVKIMNRQQLEKEVALRRSLGQREFLFQELLEIRRDLRVIIVDKEVVLFYWRINTGSEWKPTSTGHGSLVDFIHFPEQWREKIMDIFNRLGLTTGAFDIAWQFDDLNTAPYILEVSPAYKPNPPIPSKYTHLSYSKFKKIIFPRPVYILDYIALVFNIKKRVIARFLESQSNIVFEMRDNKIV